MRDMSYNNLFIDGIDGIVIYNIWYICLLCHCSTLNLLSIAQIVLERNALI